MLRGLDLVIRRGERIGLIDTGSGKSTAIDLFMGLLVPTAGRLLVDGADLHDPHHLSFWGPGDLYCPCATGIYLADSSIAENIAFGVPRDKIDMVRVHQAAKQAQIAASSRAVQKYESFVGERGIRLSGGQRQRIGIARALQAGASASI